MVNDLEKAKAAGRRCGYCKHLWKFHTRQRAGVLAPYSCSKCVQRKNMGPGFIKKGQLLGAHLMHSLRARMKHCNCFKMHQKGVCEAVVFHGPGHQSHTHCRLNGRHKIHEADYGCGPARWKNKAKTFSGYFDEPPTVEATGGHGRTRP